MRFVTAMITKYVNLLNIFKKSFRFEDESGKYLGSIYSQQNRYFMKGYFVIYRELPKMLMIGTEHSIPHLLLIIKKIAIVITAMQNEEEINSIEILLTLLMELNLILIQEKKRV